MKSHNHWEQEYRIAAFSLDATEKIFEASNILFDAYKQKCYN